MEPEGIREEFAMNKEEFSSIEVMQDLHLHCANDQHSSLRDALHRHTAPPWRHAEEKERELANTLSDMPEYLMFERSAEQELAAAAVALCKAPNGYDVVNIIPLEAHELGVTSYNDILNDFIDRIVAPASREFQFDFTPTPRMQSITDWISDNSATALHRFSVSANKATGTGHPADRKRWFQFILTAYQGEEELDTERLGRWLVEVEKWPPEVAHQLVDEYQYSIDLLQFRAAAS